MKDDYRLSLSGGCRRNAGWGNEWISFSIWLCGARVSFLSVAVERAESSGGRLAGIDKVVSLAARSEMGVCGGDR